MRKNRTQYIADPDIAAIHRYLKVCDFRLVPQHELCELMRRFWDNHLQLRGRNYGYGGIQKITR